MEIEERDGPRSGWVHSALRWCALSVAWALLAGGSSVAAGFAARSVALVGFGLDSVIDGSASAVLVWRFRHERAATAQVESVERIASRAVGVAMILVAAYLIAAAANSLAGRTEPSDSVFGAALAGASLAVLPVLAHKKLGLARRLGSRALRGDGVLSAAGSVLAATTLAGLLLDAALDWWWSDAVAALLIALAVLREGVATLSSRTID